MTPKLFTLLVLAGVVSFVAGQDCFPPYVKLGGQCVFVEYDTQKSWQEAREFCASLAGDGTAGDLATFPTCDEYTTFVRYLALNVPVNTTVWVGAHSLFTPNMWQWLTEESLQTGVPFWAYPEEYNGTENCAAASGSYYYRLVDAHCDLTKLIGNNCYVFEDHVESWERAEQKCREEHDHYAGLLYYPSSCEEFTHMAHHLEADERRKQYWVGGIDVSGKEEWTWVEGGIIPSGPPYWASGEPSHQHDNRPRKHCTIMDPSMRYYLRDEHCNDYHPYICKLTKV
ncbi:macrophage mannose receptor 1-like 3 [Homarus americanus]|uniref:Macrophage mannose receptor 1-like 3 n=1 Tax=Homarus americanus TaxID=6706 RepID=A0A8J5JQA6_HOMAM|nr:macrophage mannose receptor 1-like 3 [Homarus americanus]